MNLVCLLFGHDDPVLDLKIPEEERYYLWKTQERNCKRCNKELIGKGK